MTKNFYFRSINKVGGRKLLDLLNQGSSNGLDHVMVTSRDIFQPTCGHFQSCNKGQGDTMDEMTILYIIQYLHYLWLSGRLLNGDNWKWL